MAVFIPQAIQNKRKPPSEPWQGSMEDVPDFIHTKYQHLAILHQTDIKFSDLPTKIREDIGKTIAVSGKTLWKQIAYECGMTNEDIEFAATLQNHAGSAVLNMFDFYMESYKNSLWLLVCVLGKMKNDRILTKISDLWPDILKSRERMARINKQPKIHDMSIHSSTGPSTNISLEHSGSSIYRNQQRMLDCHPLGNGLMGLQPVQHQQCNTDVSSHSCLPISETMSKKDFRQQYPQQQAPDMFCPPVQVTGLQQAADTQLVTAKYHRTKAWVEQHRVCDSVMNEKLPEMADDSMQDVDGAHVMLMSHEGEQVKYNRHQNNLVKTSPKSEVMDHSSYGWPANGFHHGAAVGLASENTQVKSEKSNVNLVQGKLPSFTTSFNIRPSANGLAVKAEARQITPGITNHCSPFIQASLQGSCVDSKACGAPLCQMHSHRMKTEPMDCTPSQLECLNNRVPSPTMKSPDGVRHNYLTIPLSKSERRLLECPMDSLGSSGRSLMKSPSCTGKMESCPYKDEMRNSTVFITHLYQGFGPCRTKRDSYNNNCAISLARCLRDNAFRIQIDVPNSKRLPCNWKNWIDRKFSESNYVVVCVTPEYLQVVNATNVDDSELLNNIQSTRYIYRLMQHEFEERGGQNRRFIPVLFAKAEHHVSNIMLPNFLQAEGMGPYMWSRDYMDLLWRLDRHEVRPNLNVMQT